jgi:Flp pilus assembly protein TadB
VTALVWLLLAAAVLLVPGPARELPAGPDAPRGAARCSPRVLQLIAAAGVGATCVAVLGPLPGLVGAALAAPAAVFAAGRAAARADRPRPDAALALALDLTAAALRGGQPVAAALALGVPAAQPQLRAELLRVSGLLRLGADPDEAWRIVAGHDVLAPVAAAARRSAHSGARLADAFDRLAADVRADLRVRAEARAQRAGVFAIAPLGLCFLPAFVCLGVVPVVVAVARGIAVTLP